MAAVQELNLSNPAVSAYIGEQIRHFDRYAPVTETLGAVDGFMTEYKRRLDEVRLGSMEASHYRKELYVGDDVKFEHGVVQPTQHRVVAGPLRQLSLVDVPTVEPRATLAHAIDEIQLGLGLPIDEPSRYPSVPEIEAAASKPEKEHMIVLNRGQYEDWVLKVKFVKVKNSPEQHLQLALTPGIKESLEGLKRYREGERAKADSLRTLSQQVEATTPESIAEKIAVDYQITSLGYNPFPTGNISYVEVRDAIEMGRKWKQYIYPLVGSTDEKAISAFYAVPHFKKEYAVFIPHELKDIADANLIIVVGKDEKSGHWKTSVVLSRAEIAKNRENFQKEAGRIMSDLVKEQLDAAALNVTDCPTSYTKVIELNPRELVRTTFKLWGDNKYSYRGTKDKLNRAYVDLATPVARAIGTYADQETYRLMTAWEKLVQQRDGAVFINKQLQTAKIGVVYGYHIDPEKFFDFPVTITANSAPPSTAGFI